MFGMESRSNHYLAEHMIIADHSCRATLQNPQIYPEPDKFIPERFLEGNNSDIAASMDPTTIVFGYGRRYVTCCFPALCSAQLIAFHIRICPGRYLADAIMFLYIASILYTFNVTPPVDENGNPIRIEPRATTGISS